MSIPGASNGPGPADDRFAELSEILLGPERADLRDLQERLDNPEARAQDVSAVLVEAIRLRTNDKRLRKALQPTIEEAISMSVRKNPRMLADALFPILGKAIRKAIDAELGGLMQSLSVALEQSVSARSLRWRLEAFRTRRPYAEIVLLRSALYRVEQVFLIHRETGLLLQHAVWRGVDAKDPEAVAGMLTAIQDFARDSITGAEGQDLETVRLGEFSVVLAYGPHVILAGFVRGVVPRHLSRVFQDTLDSIEQENSATLKSFDGDTTRFDVCHPHLEACLLGQGEPQTVRSTSRFTRWLVIGVPALLGLTVGAWWLLSARADRRWRSLVEQLRSEPGIVVTAAEKRGGGYYLSGLRDPLARDPASVLASTQVPIERISAHWEPYHSLAPQFVAQRTYSDLKGELEKTMLRFKLGSAEIAPKQLLLLEEAASRITALLSAATSIGKNARVEVIGNHDPLGTEQSNVALAQGRAANVRAALVMAGVPQANVSVRPHDPDDRSCDAESEEQRLLCRTASFKVIESPRQP